MSFPTSRNALIWVSAALVLLFSFATFLNSAYRATRRNRAEERFHDGLALAAAGRDAEAVDEFRAALTYTHNDARYTLALSRSLVKLGRRSEAETYLNELREDDPTDAAINLMLARIASQNRRDDDAVTYYQRAIYGFWPERSDPGRLTARFELVDLLDRGRQHKEALAELLQLADTVPPADNATRQRVAALLLSHGSPEHAADLFRAILGSQPHDAAAREGLAHALFAMGDYAGARSAYRLAQRDGASNAALDERLAISDAVLQLDPSQVRLSANQRFERARELLERAQSSAAQCGSLAPGLAENAQQLLSASEKRRRDGDTVQLVTLAEQIWKDRQSRCAPQSDADRALDAVMAKLQKQ